MSVEGPTGPLRDLEIALWGPDGPGGPRHWPPEESQTDRWARAREFGFGQDSCVHYSSYLYGKVEAGNHVWVGPFALLDASGGLTIGDFTMICAGVQIYSHDSVRWAISGGAAECDKSPVTIGSRCYIGAGSIITRGVSIGDGTVVGAGSLVNSDLPPGSVAVGRPARVIGMAEIGKDGELRISSKETPSPND